MLHISCCMAVVQAWMRQLGLGSKPRPAAGSASDGAAGKASVAAAALAAAKAAASAAGAARMGGTITVQEQRRFAGQTITVNKEVAAGSKEAQKAAAEAEAAARKQAGLDAVLASLQQAKKVGARCGSGTAAACMVPWAGRCARREQRRRGVPLVLPEGKGCRTAACQTAEHQGLPCGPPLPGPPPPPLSSAPPPGQVTVLDKSRADWKDYKKKDETVEEELEMHKRSADQVGRAAPPRAPCRSGGSHAGVCSMQGGPGDCQRSQGGGRGAAV